MSVSRRCLINSARLVVKVSMSSAVVTSAWEPYSILAPQPTLCSLLSVDLNAELWYHLGDGFENMNLIYVCLNIS